MHRFTQPAILYFGTILADGEPDRIDPDKWRPADHELSTLLRPRARKGV